MNISLDIIKLFDIQKTENTIKVVILFFFLVFVNYSKIFMDTGLLPPIVKQEIFTNEIQKYIITLSSISDKAVYRAQFYSNGTVENNLHLMVTDSTQRATLTLLLRIVLPTIVAIIFWTFLAVCLYAKFTIDENNSLFLKKQKLLNAFKIVAPFLFIFFTLYSGYNLFAKF